MAKKKIAKGRQSAKPRPDWPLTLHSSGQWIRKVRGRTYYFGHDPDAALKEWLRVKDYRLAGLEPPPKDAEPEKTIKDLANSFLTHKRTLVDGGEMSDRTWSSYKTVCETLVDFFGRDKPLRSLTPTDFLSLRAKLAKANGPIGLSNSVQRIRTIMHYSNDVLDIPVKFGRKSFTKASQRKIREHRQLRGSKMIEADELRKMLDAARQPLRAMIMLSINTAMGQSDIANLPSVALNLDSGWVDFARVKTATSRRVPLWPETIAAIRDWLPKRPAPKDCSDDGLMFITKYGQRFVRTKSGKTGAVVAIDGISQEFRKLLRELKINKPGNFYNLRRTFRTICDQCADRPAVDAIMGHIAPASDMGARYVQRIDDSRLRAVVDTVHKWLFGNEEEQ